MKKYITIFTLVLFLCSTLLYSQTKYQNSDDGTYEFKTATFTISNYDTKAEVNNQVINDPASLDKANMIFPNVFTQAVISNGQLSSCTLPDQKEYMVTEDVKLTPGKDYKEPADKSQENSLTQLSPYTFSIENSTLTFSVRYLYGDSQYSFPLEGKLTVILIKQR